MNNAELEQQIQALFRKPERTPAALRLLSAVREALQAGTARVVTPPGPGFGRPEWTVNLWVKQGLLLMANLGLLASQEGASRGVEMDTLPWRTGVPDGTRMPAGSSIRTGSFLEPGVTFMPPSVLQIGTYIGSGTAIDSFVNIGIAAQIGKGVQLSSRSTVGGWLMPLQATPTIVEDGAVLGVGSGVYDGAQIGERAVLLAGTQVIPSLGVYDTESAAMLPVDAGKPLRIPAGAIVAMGSRPIGAGIAIQIPVIVGRRTGNSPQDWVRFTDLHFSSHAG